MTEQEAAVDAVSFSPGPLDNKRRLDELEPQRPQPEDVNGSAELKPCDVVEGVGVVDSDIPEAKRFCVDVKPAADENGHLVENVSSLELNKVAENPVEKLENAGNNNKLEEANMGNEEKSPEGSRETEKVDATTQELTTDEGNKEITDAEQPPKENLTLGGTSLSAEDEVQPSHTEFIQEDDLALKEKANTDTPSTSRKMEIPNNKVGVLIGKAGDTIRYLQINSGAKIQITRDAEADPRAPTRPVELIGSLESIEKAEKLIKDVISEADAGGAPSLIARGIATAQTAIAAEQIQMHVPNDKVGMIIGKGGETIKYLQSTSGARIQLIPQHLPEGDQSTERIVRVSGDKNQIEIAREMIMEVMTQPMRNSPRFGGYNHQGGRYHGASGAWGPRGGHYAPNYDYHQRPYPSQNPMHRPRAYDHYSGPNYGPRGGYGPGWQQQPPMHRPPYDSFGRSGRFMDGSAGARGHPIAPNMGPIPSQANHNYGQPHGGDYGYPPQYAHVAPPAAGYGHGYDEIKYGNPTPVEHPYGGQGNTQTAHMQNYPGYAAPNQQFGKPAPYSMPIPSQPAAPQAYGPPRQVQPEAPYQAVNAGMVQQYGQNVAPQQHASYATGAPAQPSYPAYQTADGYSQPQQTAPPVYVQQTASGYAQPVAQQAPAAYAQQAGPTYSQPTALQVPSAYASQGVQPGTYVSYPTSQPGYTDQSAATNAAYGYQATATAADPNAVYSAPVSSQQGYAQPQAVQAQQSTQQGYVQSQPAQAQQSTQQGYAQPQPVQPAAYDQSATK